MRFSPWGTFFFITGTQYRSNSAGTEEFHDDNTNNEAVDDTEAAYDDDDDAPFDDFN
ncbi:conserved hypothetical protein [Ricinus communis]|uniref:Uncharacterized protein n=1 Tax=Ricinus communis TaxID=3988 RepID=B9SUJ6_RICCO|nr:conserved hypothetical protein [Ricinus communis]